MDLKAEEARQLLPEMKAALSEALMCHLEVLIMIAAEAGESFIITEGPNGEFIVEGPLHRYPAEVRKVILDLQSYGFDAHIQNKALYVGWE